MGYIETFKIALISFPFIALFLTIPFILIEYHRYGSINKFRTLIIYSFILYLLTIYLLVILPLPSREEVLKLTTPKMNLIPFNFILDIIKESSFVLNKPSTYLKSLTDPCIYVVVFNIFMTIPFGIYLRYYYKCSLKKTVILSFLLSLFFELTQLTGLYFIYERPYRMFDVDDLMLNTLGGLIGYFISGLIINYLPTRDKIDEDSINKGKTVSGLRRITLYLLDTTLYLIIYVLILLIINKPYIKYILFIVYFVIIPFLFNGYTLGSKFLNIKFSFPDKRFLRLFIRAIITYFYYFGLVYFISIIIMKLTNYFNLSTTVKLIIALSTLIGLFIFYLLNTIKILKCAKIYYDKFSKVEFVSTIKDKDK